MSRVCHFHPDTDRLYVTGIVRSRSRAKIENRHRDLRAVFFPAKTLALSVHMKPNISPFSVGNLYRDLDPQNVLLIV